MAEGNLATVTCITEFFLGKAREVYSALTQSTDYDVIKKNVLKAYEFVPEAYRQKF